MKHLEVLFLASTVAIVSACATPSVETSKDKDNEYKTVVSKSGVGGEGGPMITCLTTFDTKSKKIIHDDCASYRGTAQGAVEVGVPAAVGLGATLGSAGIIRGGMASDTNVTVQGNSSSSSSVAPSAQKHGKKSAYNQGRSGRNKSWGHVR